MSWPTPQEYNEAIQNPGLNFRDLDLKVGSVDLTPLGLPRPITGNFASVYRIRSRGKDWAVRCFWREYADMRERYDAIARHLGSVSLPYMVRFDYLDQGIAVRGQWYPILKMEWVEGELLTEHVRSHLHDARAMKRLADDWQLMMERLSQASIAHGDLQHGNVLVTGSGIRLVDYDGMFVPALAGRTGHEIGHQNYQHPTRSALDFGHGMDHFSAWSIYVSLIALSIDPNFWTRVGAGDECLLFRGQDFRQPAKAEVLALLRHHADRQLRELSGRFSAFISSPASTPPLGSAASGVTGSTTSHGSRLLPPSRAVWRAIIPGPARAPTVSIEPVQSRMSSWIADHVKPIEASVSSPDAPRFLQPLVVFSLITVLGSAGIAAGLHIATISSCLIVSAAILTADAILLLGTFRRHPLVRSLSSVAVSERRLLRRLDRAHRQVQVLQTEKSRLAGRAQGYASIAAKRKAKVHERSERKRDRIKAITQDRLTKLEELDGRLENWRKEEQVRRLTALQQEHLAASLKKASLLSASISGLRLQARLRLWLAGIRRARDVTAARLENMSGLGKSEIASVVRWRVSIESLAKQTMPGRLSDRVQRRIENRHRKGQARLQRCRESVIRDSASIDSLLVDEAAVELQQIDARFAQRSQQSLERQQQLDRAAAELEAEGRQLERGLVEVHAELRRYTHVTLGRWVRSAFLPS